MNIKQIIYLIIGLASLTIGSIGIIIPILPTVPFFLAAAFCFARSSSRLHTWFLGTKVYKKHLDSFVKKKGMTAKTKATILISVTVVMGLGFAMMGAVPVGRAVLAIVWLCHLIYFIFGVKTIKNANDK